MFRLRLLPLTLCACIAAYTPLVSQSHVSSAQWKAMKQQLVGPSGREYFETNLKNCLLSFLEGTLISSKALGEGDEFLVAVQDYHVPDVKLRLKRHLQNSLPTGTPVIFEGVMTEFIAEPFMVVLDVEDVNRSTNP